jgi:hypothetical protein
MIDAARSDELLSTAIRQRLEQRLEDWAAEYLNGGDIGWRDRNILQAIVEHQGFIPSARRVPSQDRTPADEVEDIVLSMRNAGWWLHSRILRMDYWRPEPPMSQRLDIIRSWGVTMARSGYFTKLAEAKLFVAGALFG